VVHERPPIEDNDRFQRFVYLHERSREAELRAKSKKGGKESSDSQREDRGKLQALADQLSRRTLVDSLVNDGLKTPHRKAAVAALSMRTDPSDISELLDLFNDKSDKWVRMGALRCLKNRGPVSDEVIGLVMKAMYEDEEDRIRSDAARTLEFWEKKHGDRLRRYVECE